MKRLILILLIITATSCRKTGNEISIPEEDNKTSPRNLNQLPKRLGFGLENDNAELSGMITQGDYRYHYLSGDIFSDGWATWNQPTGAYAVNFMNQTRLLGKIPVFTYYTIVGAKYRYEDPAFTNLNDQQVMYKYFQDWVLLMKQCANFAKTVIVHYEPDMMGYLQIYKNDPLRNKIKVASSGFSEVSAYSNDASGLFKAIVYLRNKYAPNVLLGWHASQWATGKDLIKGKENPEELASETAAYYKSLGASFDLMFCEFSDRDSGYYQVVQGQVDAWWSTQATPSNGQLSDFDRFGRFLKQLNTACSQKIFLWQIPIGNTLKKSCNNTPGHYKDNRAEYFFQPLIQANDKSRLEQYAQCGVIAMLFGAGANECTSYFDKRKDGVTAQGESADDEGGYLRSAFAKYYAGTPVGIK